MIKKLNNGNLNNINGGVIFRIPDKGAPLNAMPRYYIVKDELLANLPIDISNKDLVSFVLENAINEEGYSFLEEAQPFARQNGAREIVVDLAPHAFRTEEGKPLNDLY